MRTGSGRLYQVFSALAVMLSSACSDHGADPAPGRLGTTVQNLSGGDTHERCDTLPADLVWNGGGFVRTGTGYTAHNGTNECWDAFLIDLNDYDRKYIDGTRISYGRVVPRDEATCRRISVKGHFWRKNANGTTTYLGVASRKGRWITGSTLPPRCEVPSFVVERDVPGYAPGASYRLALTARENRATSGYDRREIVVATRTPDFGTTTAELNSQVMKLRSQLTSTTLHPAIARQFARRGTRAGAMQCRVAQLEVSVLRLSQNTSFVQLGADSNEASRAVEAYRDLVQSYCGTGSLTALQFQALLMNFIDRFHAMKKTIWVTNGLTPAEGSVLIASTLTEDVHRIMGGCGANLVEVFDFVRTGATPSGMIGPNVLLRECAGSNGNIQLRLGMQQSASPIRASLRECILGAFDTPPIEQQAGICSDPRATGGGTDCPGNCHEAEDASDPCVKDPMGPDCLLSRDEDTGLEIHSDPEVTAETVAEWQVIADYNEAKDEYTKTSEEVDKLTLASREARAAGSKLDEVSEWGSIAGEAVNEMEKGKEPSGAEHVLKGIGKAAKIYSKAKISESDQLRQDAEELRQQLPELERERQRRLEVMCKEVPDHEDCKKPTTPPADPAKRCPETDLGDASAWFSQINGQQLTVADRIQSCTCEAMRRGAFELASGEAANLLCMTAEERRAFDCQTNPWGDDDGRPHPLLRPECRNAFQPSGLDRDSLLAGLCKATRCAEDQVAVGAFGRCVCVDQPTPTDLASICNFNGSAGQLDCGPLGGTLVCDEAGPRCVDTEAGRTPFGNNPLCQLPGRTIQLGARPAWGEATPNAFHTAIKRVGSTTRPAFMMKPGFQLLAGPSNFERTYFEVGSELVLEVDQPSQLPADRGSLQAYCSNEEAGVHNVFLGQRELDPGLNVERFPFDERCWGDGTTPMHVGVAVRTAANQASRAAFLGYYFGGTIRAVDGPVPPCGDGGGPDPAPPVLDRGMLGDIVTGNIRPGIIAGTWTHDIILGSGSLDARLIPVDRAVFFR